MSRENHTITDDMLNAYVDNQLSENDKNKVEEYLRVHPDAAERVAAYQIQNEYLHQLFDEPPSEDITTIKFPNGGQATRKPRVAFNIAASVALLSIGAISGWISHDQLQTKQIPLATFTQAAGVAHAVYSAEVLHPVEVTAEQEQHLVNWLSKRLKTKVKAPNLTELGWQLMGGRLLSTASGPAAQFMYENEAKERVTLYIRSDIPNNSQTTFQFKQSQSVNIFYWVDGPVGYALSSQIQRAKLLPITQRVYHQQ